MTREECTAQVLEAIRRTGVSYARLAEATGRHPVFVATALHGQATLDADEAAAVTGLLGLGEEVAAALQERPTKGQPWAVPADPFLYRFHEITQVFGTGTKAVVQEEFGDGIMSAIDFDIDVQRVADPQGDRVRIVYTGKFLPYKKW